MKEIYVPLHVENEPNINTKLEHLRGGTEIKIKNFTC
jgi:hypothetical protein